MFELIPSLRMRKIIKDNAFRLSDCNKATLIWNAPRKRIEKLEAIKELSETTADEKLRMQIQERLEYEKKAFEIFIDNSTEKYVYVVNNSDGYAVGFFLNYKMAKSYLMSQQKENQESNKDYRIEKQLIVANENDLKVKSAGKWDSNLGESFEDNEFENYGGDPMGYIEFDDQGNITYIWSSEMNEEDENQVDDYRKERFEFQYFAIPFEGEIGMIVKDIICNEYGVLMTDTEEWKKFLEIKAYKDFGDIAVVVYYLNESGRFVHRHVNPFYLEEVDILTESSNELQTSTVYIKAINSFSNYWKQEKRADEETKKALLREIIKWVREYHKTCMVNKLGDEVKDIYSLMW